MPDYCPFKRYDEDGSPYSYQRDLTGVLPNAVRSFFHTPGAPSPVEMARLTSYCGYYIKAPCWFTLGMEQTFATLRQEIEGITTKASLANWLGRALEVGIDPF